MEIVEILMSRDGITRAEAEDLVEEVRNLILDAIDNGDDPEEILMDELGLEPDYILELL